ncbi:MAG: hypothetical protein WC781_04895 [Candidatus Pacearchaeota archaeon]|jgi:hypothetical protein
MTNNFIDEYEHEIRDLDKRYIESGLLGTPMGAEFWVSNIRRRAEGIEELNHRMDKLIEDYKKTNSGVRI